MKMTQLHKRVERRHHSTMKVLLCFVTLVIFAHSQAKPQYKEDLGQYVPDNSGQYIHDDSGRYIPDNSGDYSSDGLGGYRHDGTGGYKPDGTHYQGVDNQFFRQKDFGSYKTGSKNFENSFFDRSSIGTKEYSKISSVNLIGSGSAVSKQTVRPTKVNSVDNQVFGNFASAASPIAATSKLPVNSYDQNRYSSNPDGKWKIVRQGEDIDNDGYHWEYETENKIIAEESGKLANKGTDKEAMRAKGFYQYIGPDQVPYSVTYTADENGFVPVGSHLPTPPPIPAGILKALDYLRSLGKL